MLRKPKYCISKTARRDLAERQVMFLNTDRRASNTKMTLGHRNVTQLRLVQLFDPMRR